ncbi:glycerophosphodiester phosphodiesterase [Bremerella cremea]|nr:glycerophosphodiester phosphodiesterase [Bremerella cremea]
MSQLASEITRNLWNCGRTLVATDLLYKLLTFILLTPLLSSLFRLLLAAFGDDVLSDVDIVIFLLGPAGWFCSLVVGTLWLGIVIVAQASLLGVLASHEAGAKLTPIGALQFAAKNGVAVLRLTLRLIVVVVLAIVPFLLVAGAVYWALLTEYDINYYLKENPPVFRVSLGIGAVLAIGLGALMLWLVASYLLAIPLVLFEGVAPGEALRQSRLRVRGHRFPLITMLFLWGIAMLTVSTIASSLLGWLWHHLVPDSTSSLQWLVASIGVGLVCLSLVNLTINLLGTTTFASMLFACYRNLGAGKEVDLSQHFALSNAEDDVFQITRFRLACAGIVGVLLAILIGLASMDSVQMEDNVQIMAHRGASSTAPENTLASIHHAIEAGANWIEIDVQETADGEVVVFHDSDFMRQAHNRLKLWNARHEDLQKIDIGSWFAPEFSAERVPTLAEVLATCKGKIKVNIELKYYGHDQQLEQRVADIVDQQGMASQIMIMSLKRKAVAKMKALRPNWKVGLLLSVATGNLKKLDADFLAINARFATPMFIQNAHDNHKDIYVWTVNDATTMSTMISRGVDGILTDKPALARSVLRQRNEMSTPERLLLEFSTLLGIPPNIAPQ